MKSIKCSKCSFVSSAGSKICKNCKADISEQTFTKSTTSASQKNFQKPSLTAIISNDQMVVVVGIILPLVMWGIFIAMNVFGFTFTSKRSETEIMADSSGGQIFLPLGFTIFGLIVTFLRVNYINSIFKNGIQTVGEIMEINFIKDRGSIIYSYSWNGNKFKGYNSVMKNSRTEYFQNGQPISIILNSEKPQQSLPANLYS